MTAGERGRARSVVGGVAFTLLFAVIAAVSAVALVRTVARPFDTGSYGVAQWGLFAVTLVGSALAFVRSMRFYASLSLLARTRAAGSDAVTESEDGTAVPQRRMHPLLDDLSWAVIALVVAAINALAVWAVLATLEALFGGSDSPTGWLAWQLALLTAALAALLRFAGAVAAELRDRSRRRRRNLVHIITGKLISWPGGSQSAPSGGRWKGRAVAAGAAAAFAAAAWASASGPLLDPAPDRGAAPGDHEQRTQGASGPAGAGGGAPPAGGGAPPARAQTRSPQAEAAHRRSRSARARRPSPNPPGSGTAPPPVVTPAPPDPPQLSPPPATGTPTEPPATAPRPTTRPRRKSPDHRARKRHRRQQENRTPQTPPTTPTPTPVPTPPPTVPAPAPIPPPTTPPPPTVPTPEPNPPCDPDGPLDEPPCDPWPPTPPPPPD